MRMIHEYSSVTAKHFNHSQINRGICVTKTCQEFVKGRDLNITHDRNVAIEKCLNQSIFKEYGIQAKLTKVWTCEEQGNKRALDTSDRVVAMIYLLLIILNVFGTFYDKFRGDKRSNTGNPYLLAFSVSRNWAKLTAPSGGPDPRLNRLSSLNGLRAMTMMLVIAAHCNITLLYFIDNTFAVEKYNYSLVANLFKGTVVTYTFSVISSFLLAYNLSIAREERNIYWTDCIKIAFWRYLRLTPAYALVLATAATWWRHAGDGPLWGVVVELEAATCRQYWWTNLLYINNYFPTDKFCLRHTWYLATDFQMFGLALFLYLLAQNLKFRKTVLLLAVLISLAIPAAHTYYQDLDALFLYTPQIAKSFWTDKTFNMHKGGHTNMAVYVVGLSAGYFAYHLQQSKDIEEKWKKYFWAPWVLFLLGLAVVVSGSWFNSEEGRRPLAIRVVYAALFKPVFVTLVAAVILLSMFKVESLFRGILEWRGFTWMARVSYSAFLVHVLLQTTSISSMTSLLRYSGSFKLMYVCGSIAQSLLCGALLYILLEAPTNALLKSMLSNEKRKIEKTQ